jgi:hypothetical protein
MPLFLTFGKKWYWKWKNPQESFKIPAFLNSDFPCRIGCSIIRLSRARVRRHAVQLCRIHVTNCYRQRSPCRASRPETQKACLCPQCRDATSCVLHGMRLVPRRKNLDHTKFRLCLCPQVKTICSSPVPASTDTRWLWGCSNLCRMIHHRQKSLTRRKVTTIYYHKLNFEVLVWFEPVESSGWRNRVVNEECCPSWEFTSPDSSSCLLLLTTTTL